MSKEALRKLATALNVSDPKKDFRNKIINPQTHGVDVRATSIKTEFTLELQAIAKKEDPEIFKYIEEEDIKAAASEFRRILMGEVRNPKRNVSFRDKSETYIVGSFNSISKLLAVASEAAVIELNKRISAKTKEYIPFFGKDKLVNLDHTRTVGETRLAQDISSSKINPIALIKALKSRPLTSKTEYDEVYNNILEISSYFSNGNSKNFEIKGTVEQPITGTIRSGRANQLEGTQEVATRIRAFKKAIELAIKDYDWPEQESSDSFITVALKQINNATVKAGGTGKVKNIDRNPNKSSSTKSNKQKRIITDVKALSLEANNKKPNTQNSAFTIQKINDFINARLPAAIRSNMGPQSLVNRTGRFSESGRMVDGIITPQNYLSLGYTYQRNPYDVFDKRLGSKPWNTPQRNPSAIIEKAIRDIVKEIAIGRFYLRRT